MSDERQVTVAEIREAGAYDFVQRLVSAHDAIKPDLYGTGVPVPFEATVDAIAVLLEEIERLNEAKP